MASITVPGRCLKCSEKMGTVSCEGCKDTFCIRHITAHRRELSRKFDQHLLEHKCILTQLVDLENQNEHSRKAILSRINQWENEMIERIRYKAELARERLDHLTVNDEKIIIKDARELTTKILPRNETNNLLENDIEQLKQSIVHIQQALNKLINQPDVELYIEPNYMIDWNHLIYVREKSVKTASTTTLVNKQTTDQDRKDIKNRTTLNQQRKSTSSSNSESSSSSISSDDENNSEEIDSSNKSYLFERRLSDDNISSSVQIDSSPSALEKQVSLQPISVTLPDIKQVTGKPLGIVEAVATIDINRPSSEVKSAVDETKQLDDLSRSMVELLRDNNKT